MSTGLRVPLAEARDVADELVTILGLGCERIAVAGSIRRGRADVGDVELVAIPRFEPQDTGDIWGTKQPANTLDLLLDTLLIQGTLGPHPDDPKRGDRYGKFLHLASGLQLDLFRTTEARWGLIYLIRTGPASYSQWLVTEARRRGFHVTGGELHRGGLGCGAVPCEVLFTRDEADVYAALGLPFVAPEARA